MQSVQYTAFGAVAEMRLKATPPEQTVQLRERYIYNPQRLQMTELDVERCASVACGTPEELLHLEYIYGSNNNGNPREQVIRSAGMNVRQRYDYDGLNRLRQFREEPTAGGPAVLTEDYCYDRHGNRAVLARPGLSAQTPQVTTCTEAPVLGLFPGNRIAGTSYDAGGELGSDGWNGLRFDLEGRLRKSIPGSGAETSYEYDGEGRRVVKQTGLSRTVFVYDAAGQLAAEYGSTVSESRTEFVHGDMLGSTRLVTDGQNPGTTLNPGRRFDYWPFGAELTAGDTAYRTVGFAGPGPAQRFTGKERDGETGLDYFGARYLASAQGRFTGVDPLHDSGRVEDPQSWNRYSYTLNNPIRFIDLNGMKEVSAEECARNLSCISIQLNVVLDQKADLYDNKGQLRPEIQQSIDEQIAQARDDYGSLGIHIDVSFSKGTIDSKSRTISSGALESALNVALTDSNSVGSINFAAGGRMNGGMSSIVMNMRNSNIHTGTLAHEMAHFFNGETRSSLAGALNILTVGTANAFADVLNDARRMDLRGAAPFSKGWGVSKLGRHEDQWRSNARKWHGKR